MAHNCRSQDEVDRVINEAVRYGGGLVKAPAATTWGGYSGYFSDPDGHLREVAYNPFWPIAADGAVMLPD
ncbi:MAG: VOC family protein [Hyphomicrobiaceae bacterium]